MIEVCKDLYVGNAIDLLTTDTSWSIIHAGKDPWHRKAVGYFVKSIPKDNAEYLFAVRGKELSLNIVDNAAKYFCNEVFDKSFEFIDAADGKVFLHCNKGESRSPSIAFLYMASKGLLSKNFTTAREQFKKLYPRWQPKGIIDFIEEHWSDYVSEVIVCQKR